jgi:hypothetical protein
MTTLYITFSTLVLLLMYLVFRSRRPSLAPSRLQEFNLDALAILLDPLEQQYLSQQLPPQKYRYIHRKRMRVALAYLTELENALPSSNHEVAQAALSRARLLILQLRFRAICSFLLPKIKVQGAGLREIVSALVPVSA